MSLAKTINELARIESDLEHRLRASTSAMNIDKDELVKEFMFTRQMIIQKKTYEIGVQHIWELVWVGHPAYDLEKFREVHEQAMFNAYRLVVEHYKMGDIDGTYISS